MSPRTPPKWRPTLGMIAVAVLLSVLMLPLVGLTFLRFYENQLVRQTESELIAQGAALAAAMADAVARTAPPLGTAVDPAPDPDSRLRPIAPSLDLNSDPVLGPRPDPAPALQPVDPAYVAIGASLIPLVTKTRAVTLAGIEILDPSGAVIAGRSEIGRSFAAVPEVAAALAGRYGSVLRERLTDEPPPPLYGISRGTGVRVFTAMPVVVAGRIAGVVYLSRTPDNVLRQVYQQRGRVAVAAVLILAVTLAIAFIFVRAVTVPIRQLTRRTAEIGRGDRSAIRPLTRHGTREIAELSDAFLETAERLFERSDYVSNLSAHVSHELKSPLTAIRGAAELLRDQGGEMTEDERRRFLDNIVGDSRRLSVLLERLRDLARADTTRMGGRCAVVEAVAEASAGIPDLKVTFDRQAGDPGPAVAMAKEDLVIVLKHLLENASEAGAHAVRITTREAGDGTVLEVSDDGLGLEPRDTERIFEAYYTTRREEGGTGMGLSIARSMLRAHGGSIRARPAESGATFELLLPRAS